MVAIQYFPSLARVATPRRLSCNDDNPIPDGLSLFDTPPSFLFCIMERGAGSNIRNRPFEIASVSTKSLQFPDFVRALICTPTELASWQLESWKLQESSFPFPINVNSCIQYSVLSCRNYPKTPQRQAWRYGRAMNALMLLKTRVSVGSSNSGGTSQIHFSSSSHSHRGA